MTKPLILAALAALPLATPAAALTPDELWAAWQARASDFGATLTAEAVEEADGSLLLRNLTLTEPDDDDDDSTTLPIPVTLRGAADGSVAVEVAIPSVQDIPADPDDGTPALRLEQRGATITARDEAEVDGGGIAYEVAAESLRVVTLPALDTAPVASVDLAAEMAGFVLRFADRPEADGAIRVGFAADGIAYILNMTDAFSGTTNSASRVNDIALDLAMTLPPGFDFDDMDDDDGEEFLRALRDGLSIGFDMAVGPSTSTSSASGGMVDYEYAVTGGGGMASLALDKAGLVLTASGSESTASGSSPLVPAGQIEANFGAYDMEIRVPLGAEPGPFRYRVSLDELSVNDATWDALDPGRVLPRGPASFVVDVTGVAAIDVAGMVEAGNETGMPPAPMIESLDIAALDVAVAGARLTGNGAFTFETDAGGTPVPAGTATVTLEGANRLLDALVTMGVVPPGETSDIRMGLAMAFDPGEGEDVLTSTIVAGADGSIVVNGQKVQ